MVAYLAHVNVGVNRLSFNPWIATTLGLTVIFFSPILAVFVAAAEDSFGLWDHLFATVLPRYVVNSLVLMIGVGCTSLIFGVSSAWIVVRYEFPGRVAFQWMLLLPAAVPAYLIAYTYTDFLEYAGPVQEAVRGVFGWQSAQDYWFPEIRSMGGAILIMGSVLYPYVYVMARTAFLLTPKSLYEVGMLSRRSLFWSIGLPLARPAIAAGLALVLMETISDFGTVEYFAIETLTLGIFNVWLGMNSLAAAAQIAVFSFLFIIILLALEMIARAKRQYTDTTKKSISLSAESATGGVVILCWIVCAAPVVIGFLTPVSVLTSFVWDGHSLDLSKTVLEAALNSTILAAIVAILVMTAAGFFGFVSSFQGGAILGRLTAVASIGYALPGTILAIGVVTIAGVIDRGTSDALLKIFDMTWRGSIASGFGLVIIACVIRFQAVGYGAVMSGLGRLPGNMMDANLLLGHDFSAGIRRVILPLTKMSFVAGALLVFVDVMKELPMTLLLRPFNFETLPTYVYQYAKDELLEEAALPALFIIATGLVPVLLMNAALSKFMLKKT